MFPSAVSSHLISKVYDDEGDVGHARLLKMDAAGVLSVQLLGPVLVRSLRHLEQQVEEQTAHRYNSLREEIKLLYGLPVL